MIGTLRHGHELAEGGNLPGGLELLWRPGLYPGQPDRSESNTCSAKYIIDGIVTDKPHVLGHAVHPARRRPGPPRLAL